MLVQVLIFLNKCYLVLQEFSVYKVNTNSKYFETNKILKTFTTLSNTKNPNNPTKFCFLKFFLDLFLLLVKVISIAKTLQIKWHISIYVKDGKKT